MKEWAFSICLATVVGCMVKIILPESGMGRLVNLVMSIFLLSCMFSGFIFKDFDINLNFDVCDYGEDISKKIDEIKKNQTFGEVERQLQNMVRQDLIYRKINPLKILININTKDESSILINSIEIFVKNGEEYDESMIKNYINNKYDVIPEIYLVDG